MHDKHQIIEEPCEGKLSRTVLETSGSREGLTEFNNSLPAFKQVWTEYKTLNAGSLQATLKRVDFAYQRFFNGLGRSFKFKSIRHYSGWTYPDARQGFKVHSTGDNGYLTLTDLGVSIQMRGKARIWGTPTTCTIVYRNGKWYASITLNIPLELFEESRQLGTSACGIDLGCKKALSVVSTHSNEKLYEEQIDAPKFLRESEQQIKHLSKIKRHKRPPNRHNKQKASRRWKKAQARISKVTRNVANQRANWVHQVAVDIVSSNSRALRAPRFAIIATEKLEVKNMTRKAKKGKRKKQKAGLNKSILDVGFGMLKAAIKYKVEEAGGVFVEVPTRKVKPSQTCPKCGHQSKKTLDERVHQCTNCGFTGDRDLVAALVMLLWALGTLPGFGTNLVDGEPQALLKTPHQCGGFKQLAATKRQKLALQRSKGE